MIFLLTSPKTILCKNAVYWTAMFWRHWLSFQNKIQEKFSKLQREMPLLKLLLFQYYFFMGRTLQSSKWLVQGRNKETAPRRHLQHILSCELGVFLINTSRSREVLGRLIFVQPWKTNNATWTHQNIKSIKILKCSWVVKAHLSVLLGPLSIHPEEKQKKTTG